MTTYDYLYLLDLEQSSKIFFPRQNMIKNHVLQEKIFLVTLGPKTSDKENRRMTIFKANTGLIKLVIVQKS
jgi:hypothetical protein